MNGRCAALWRCAVAGAALACAPFAVAAAPAAGPDIVFIAPANHTMPLAHFEEGRLAGGLLKDIGEAIAQRTGRHARFVTVPSKRVPIALTNGDGDGVCYVVRYWIDGDFDWTQPFIPNAAVVAARPEAPPIRDLADLADQPVGTVLGYRHPALDAALGRRFMRTDAPDMEHNLRKLAIGRVRYAVTDDLSLAWHGRNDKEAKLRADLVFETFTAQCAFSRKSHVPFAEVERAIDSLVKDGSIAAMLARYR